MGEEVIAKMLNSVANEAIAADIAQAQGWVLDVDGCIVRTSRAGGAGGEPMPGAIELVRWLRATGKQVVICTNASQKTVGDYASHLRRIGFDIADGELMTAATAAASHIAHMHGKGPVVAIGDVGLIEALIHEDIEIWTQGANDPVAVIVGAADVYHFKEVNAACLAIADKGAVLYVTVDEPWFNGGKERSVSISSAIARAISSIVDVSPVVCGKPSLALAGVLEARLGAPANKLVIVGDMASIEVRMARQMDAYGVLLLSGGTLAEQVPLLPETDLPHLIAADTAMLLETLQKHF